MRIARLVVCLVALLSILGCGSVFRVKRAGSNVQGIPFYVKTAKCVQSTVYLAPYYRLTLQSDSSVIKSETVNLSEKTYFGSAQSFIGFIRAHPKMDEQTIAQVLAEWDALKAPANNIEPYKCVAAGAKSPCELSAYLVGNTSVPKLFVDYGAQYTLNAKAPLAGTVNADYKLADDGTLTEASGQIEEKTFETAAALFPISDLIKAAAGISTKGFDASGKEIISFTLSIEHRGIKITRSYISDFAVGCPVGAALTASDDVAFEDIGPDTQEKKESADNSISVSGTIKLPKPAATDTTKPPGGAGTDKGNAKSADQQSGKDKKKGK